jgi:hypothetical protein
VSVPYRQVRARFTPDSITVYQAYGPHVAEHAARHGRFGPGFKRDRMTWIKPSFLWMMYRCGWAEKPGQERVLAIRIRREGFAWALEHSSLSHFDQDVHADYAAWEATKGAPVRVQWDPERDLTLRPLPHRAIQIGLSGAAVARYRDEWIMDIDDVTTLAHDVHALVKKGDREAAAALLPVEHPYPVSPDIATRIGVDSGGAG